MSISKKLIKVIQNTFRQIKRVSIGGMKQLMTWLLRILHGNRRGRRASQAGFVLPTVTMVILVVILLTTAILIRSFDRSKNASNYRVNEAVLNAATPAVDRARAKIDALFADPRLPRGTPSDTALAEALAAPKYNFGDETRLIVAQSVQNADGDNTTKVQSANSAWKFPVDTDNDGFFDSFTIYGVYFKNPPRKTNDTTKFARVRSPLEARSLPMTQGEVSGCIGSGLESGSDWFKTSGQLKKAFFTYTATVPITDITGLDTTKYKVYKGNKAFSSLELQQDRARIPLNNNAVWYEDDIELDKTAEFQLNGRVHTNSNLLISGDSPDQVHFYQVSSKNSCFYLPENSKIDVGGNVANGSLRLDTDTFLVNYHLYQKGDNPTIITPSSAANNISKTTTASGGKIVGYNTKAYSERIGRLLDGALALWNTSASRIPQEIQTAATGRITAGESQTDARTKELDKYFRKRVRRVPYAEVTYGNNALIKTGTTEYSADPTSGDFVLGSSGFQIPSKWMSIAPADTGLTLNFDNNKMYPYTSDPALLVKDSSKNERYLGDRLIVGNNLPPNWVKAGTATGFSEEREPQPITNGGTTVLWNGWNGSNSADNSVTANQRKITPQVQTLDDLGDFKRDGYWEMAAAKALKNPTTGALLAGDDNPGGLRVVTGAGIYIDGVSGATGTGVRNTESFLTKAPTLVTGVTAPDFSFQSGTYTKIIVWPDSLPMSNPSGGTGKGDLQMRASAVYHYTSSSDTPQVPMACVSSYYDPSTSTTARNISGLPDVSGGLDTDGDGIINVLADGTTPSPAINSNSGKSNNGVVYAFNAYTDASGRISAATGTYRAKLARQASMVFPNGRFVNEPLRKALTQIDTDSTKLTLANNAAIDTAICSLKILEGATPAASPIVKHGAIKEVAFLDGREIKAITNGTDTNKIAERRAELTDLYSLPLEQRQPLEIRATEIDLNILRKTSVQANTAAEASNNNEEFLLPNSGVIYASRNDALPDLSDDDDNLTTSPTEKQIASSRADFKLDSTRRPNAIRVINGSALSRKDTFRLPEKGLILVTDNPLYVFGEFNRHKDPSSGGSDRAEFTDTSQSFYNRAVKDTNFACRQGQTGCGTAGNNAGDQWRSATLISDSVTLLSGNFKDGFRNQGDYDLGNQAGNAVVSDRLYNGFWFNNFVTSADWNASTGYPSATNSYLTNGVTPIQRRVDFPEYIMEICREIPVSKCRPSNWVVGYDLNGDQTLSTTELSITARNLVSTLNTAGQTFNKALLGAGTTARPALQAADRGYARRIAFQRNEYNALVFTVPDTTTRKAAAKVYGVDCDSDNNSGNGIDRVCVYPGPNAVVTTATQGVTHPSPAANSLWYFTTNDTSGQPDLSSSVTYASNKPLHYLDPVKGGKKLILPNTPCFTATGVIDCTTTSDPAPAGTFNLNLPRITTTQTTYKPASDYLVCMKQNNANSGTSSDYEASGTQLQNSAQCPGAGAAGGGAGTWLAIEKAATTLETIATSATAPRPIDTAGTVVSSLAGSGATLRANPGNTAAGTVNVVTVGNLSNGAVIRLEANGVVDPVFILYKNSALNINAGITMQLDGVSPNNVFWAVSNISFDNATAGSPTRIAGNFLNTGTATPSIGNNVQIDGGRFLGFNVAPTVGTGAKVTASTDDGQPLVPPMLQIHSPTGTPSSANATVFTGLLTDNWLQHAPSTGTSYNAVFVTGDTPSRPARTGYSYEYGGGLNNFPRFLEAWEATEAVSPKYPTQINGSFVETQKSSFATAPFQTVDPGINTSLFYPAVSGSPDYITPGSIGTGFLYRGGASDRKAPFYRAPLRNWGYDVGLLSQSPDLFSRRFTSPPTGFPNEYYREVGRDDPWIKTLLCAAQAKDATTPGTFGDAPTTLYGNNQEYALPATERGSCPTS